MNTETVIRLALEQACPSGLPHTGNAPEEDHGHSSCYTIHQLISKVRELDAENAKLAAILQGPHVNVNESRIEEVDELLNSRIGRLQDEQTELSRSQHPTNTGTVPSTLTFP